MSTATDLCRLCGGSKRDPMTAGATCPRCGGTGIRPERVYLPPYTYYACHVEDWTAGRRAPLTVGELRERLTQFPDDAEVVLEGCDCHGDCNGVDTYFGSVLLTRNP